LFQSQPCCPKVGGFAEHGYGIRDRDSIVLASQLASAFLGKFRPMEVVATSEGELQFSMGIAIPSEFRNRAPLTTAWIAEAGAGIRLTTAYLDYSRTEYSDVMELWTTDDSIDHAWSQLVDIANRQVAGWNGDGVNARPRIFIPRSGLTRGLARELVRTGESHGTFKRSAIGGRCVLVPIGPGMSWQQAAYVAFSVQVQLGMRGVRSLPDVWVD